MPPVRTSKRSRAIRQAPERVPILDEAKPLLEAAGFHSRKWGKSSISQRIPLMVSLARERDYCTKSAAYTEKKAAKGDPRRIEIAAAVMKKRKEDHTCANSVAEDLGFARDGKFDIRMVSGSGCWLCGSDRHQLEACAHFLKGYKEVKGKDYVPSVNATDPPIAVNPPQLFSIPVRSRATIDPSVPFTSVENVPSAPVEDIPIEDPKVKDRRRFVREIIDNQGNTGVGMDLFFEEGRLRDNCVAFQGYVFGYAVKGEDGNLGRFRVHFHNGEVGSLVDNESTLTAKKFWGDLEADATVGIKQEEDVEMAEV